MKKDYSSQESVDKAFLKSCSTSNFKKIKYLLTSPDLEYKANVTANDSECLDITCAIGNLEIVKYLLSSPELKEYPSMKNKNYYCFITACENGHVEILDYLFTLENKIDNYENLLLNCMLTAYALDKKNIVEYIIFEKNIEKSEIIESAINLSFRDKSFLDGLFEKRTLNNNLKNSLEQKQIKNIKNKI